MTRLRTILFACLTRSLWLGLALVSVAGPPSVAHAQDERPRFERAGPPESFRRFVRDLEPVERRAVMRRLRGMRPLERRRFFEEWEGLSEAERLERRDAWRRDFRDRRGELGGQVELPEEMRQRLESLDPAERERAREAVSQLPFRHRARLRRALENWDRLTPEQQERVRGFVDRIQRFPEERRERIERNRPAWEGMEDERRDAMRQRLELFRSLDPGQQEELVRQRFGDRSAEEQARILERLRSGTPPP